MAFSGMEVLAIVGFAVSIVGVYFGIRTHLHKIKYDTGVIREWLDEGGAKQVRELHQWHDNRDENGRFRWTNSSAIEAAVVSLADTNKAIHVLLKGMDDKLDKVLAQHGK